MAVKTNAARRLPVTTPQTRAILSGEGKAVLCAYLQRQIDCDEACAHFGVTPAELGQALDYLGAIGARAVAREQRSRPARIGGEEEAG